MCKFSLFAFALLCPGIASFAAFPFEWTLMEPGWCNSIGLSLRFMGKLLSFFFFLPITVTNVIIVILKQEKKERERRREV